jgi:hypothetical protein
LGIFIHTPSFPTPDKLLVFLTFVFMGVGQARNLLFRLVPFVGLLLVYDSFRGLAHSLNTRVEYRWMPDVDIAMFGRLPTAKLQDWLWHGYVRWYDFIFYLAYMLHFILPIALAILIWKKRESHYWQVVSTYVVLSFAGFITYWALPAAPPWMASDRGYIEPITRVSSHVWYALGIHDFPSVYDHIAANPVAAVPSLHAAYSVLFSMFIFKFFGRRWGLLSAIYPLILCVGVVYQGEHYVIDVIWGILYAVAAYYLTGWFFELWRRRKQNNPKAV